MRRIKIQKCVQYPYSFIKGAAEWRLLIYPRDPDPHPDYSSHELPQVVMWFPTFEEARRKAIWLTHPLRTYSPISQADGEA